MEMTVRKENIRALFISIFSSLHRYPENPLLRTSTVGNLSGNLIANTDTLVGDPNN